MNSNTHLVIMAGGIGSRFWPMSTQDCPKQFVDVMGCGRTLIQLTADRFEGICCPQNIWVVTSAKYADIVRKQLPQIPESNILQEPCMRNTAPCIAYVSWKIKKQHPKANIVVTPSDHLVMNVKEFQRVIQSSLEFVDTADAILTLGMKPTRPETGYGYIEADLSAASATNDELYRVDAFKEKPDKETAEKYLAKSTYLWNAGVFVWNVNTIVNALRIYEPGIARIFESLTPYYYTDGEQENIDKMFPECQNISIDYAILEKVEEVFVFPAEFGWSDLGTWGSLQGLLDKDARGNAWVGQEVELVNTHNCMVHLTEEKRVIIVGLNDYIVAEKDGSLLICPLSEEQNIKKYSK